MKLFDKTFRVLLTEIRKSKKFEISKVSPNKILTTDKMRFVYYDSQQFSVISPAFVELTGRQKRRLYRAITKRFNQKIKRRYV